MTDTIIFAGVEVSKEKPLDPKPRIPYEFEYAYKRVMDAIEYVRLENKDKGVIEGLPNLEHWVNMFLESALIEVEEYKNVSTGTVTSANSAK